MTDSGTTVINHAATAALMVTVFIERERRELEQDFSGRISELLELLKVNKETVVVVKNGEVVSEQERCGEGDELKLLSVISGG